jgi:hypothetical protein
VHRLLVLLCSIHAAVFNVAGYFALAVGRAVMSIVEWPTAEIGAEGA